MRYHHNIEPAAFHKGYVGYGHGTVWKITHEGRYWIARPADTRQNTPIRLPRLRDLSDALD